MPESPTSQNSETFVVTKRKKIIDRKKIIIIFLILLILIGLVIAFLIIRKNNTQTQQKLGEGEKEAQKAVSTGVTIESGMFLVVDDGFDGPLINSSNWSVVFPAGEARVTQENSGLYFLITGNRNEYTSAQVDSKFYLSGDFVTQVDYQLLEASSESGATILFHGNEGRWDNGLFIYINRLSESEDSVSVYSLLSGEEEFLGSIKLKSAFAQTVSIEKKRKIVRVFIGERLVGEKQDFDYDGDIAFSLKIDSYGPEFPAVSALFDNFVIYSDE